MMYASYPAADRSTLVRHDDGGRRRSPFLTMLPAESPYSAREAYPGGAGDASSRFSVIGLAGLAGAGTQIATGSASVAGEVASQAIATGVISASTAWIPVIGAAVVGISLWLNYMAKRGAQKVASTHIADEIEQQLQANLIGYLQGPRTPASQAWALQNFDAAWQLLASAQGCGNPELGAAGVRCISERQAGARPPWGANWFELYRDPIANDTPREPGSIAAAAEGVLANPDLIFSPGYSGWLIPAGLILAGVLL